ncbi:MAG: GerMN domain-containing protein [Chloroflexia bacterium]|nr:GerMN domain-containing protein [Chloroflexia bacterium]
MKALRMSILLVVTLVVLAACSPAAEPTPTPGPTATPAAPVQVFFGHRDLVDGPDYVLPVERSVPVGVDPARASIEALLEGPTAEEREAGYLSSIPSPEEVQAFRQRAIDEGYEAPYDGDRVELRSLEITDQGIAVVDFSREMLAYGGGSMRVTVIRQQVEKTLEQFPHIEAVSILIGGEQEGILEP